MIVGLNILILLLSLVYAQVPCDPAQCNPCAGGNGQTDYVFILDCSGSMQVEIDTVTGGFSAFVGRLALKNVDARYAIVVFAELPEIVQEFTSNANLTESNLARVKAYQAVPGFEHIHLAQETGFETIAMVLGKAPDSTLGCGSTPPCSLTWRARALRFLFLVTDEDSDKPWLAANIFAGQLTREPPQTFPTNTSDGWYRDRQRTVDAIISTGTYITLLINIFDLPTTSQYGNPDATVSNPDFSGYKAADTLNNLEAVPTQVNCLEAQVLRAGLYARAFHVLDIAKPGFIQNIFNNIVEVSAACEGTSSCFASSCDALLGCVNKPLCGRAGVPTSDPFYKAGCVDNCYIGGVCYGFSARNPANSCEKCDPTSNTWRSCYDGNSCTADLCSVGGQCVFSATDPSVCTALCNRCLIGGTTCYEQSALNPTDACQYCDPIESDRRWSNITWSPACSGSVIVNPTATDDDGDNIINSLDNCRYTFNPTQIDTDNDTRGDACDPCPTNALDQSCYLYDKVCSLQGNCTCPTDPNGIPVCQCGPLYFGVHCEHVLDCNTPQLQNCNGHGRCVPDFTTGAACECDNGWAGAKCERTYICGGGNGCLHGTCVSDQICSCAQGWSLDAQSGICIVPYYCPPIGVQCNGHGTCGTATFQCTCTSGYTGSDCSISPQSSKTTGTPPGFQNEATITTTIGSEILFTLYVSLFQ